MTRRKDPWATTPNAKRKRKMTMITLSPEGLERLDRLRGSSARGAYIEGLLVAGEVLNLHDPKRRRKK